MKFRRLSGCAVMALALFMAAGCGGESLGVKPAGKVTIKGKGPLTKGTIQFQSVKLGLGTGSAEITAEGKFELAVGIPDGDYKVLILNAVEGGGYNPDGPSTPEKKLLNAKYDTAETSDLTAKVPGGPYDFEVEPAE